jgi:hypothetical protein
MKDVAARSIGINLLFRSFFFQLLFIQKASIHFLMFIQIANPSKFYLTDYKILKKNKIVFAIKIYFLIQCKPLNGITSGRRQTDSNNGMIIISKWASMFTFYEKVVLGHVNLEKFDHIDHFITLFVIYSEIKTCFGSISLTFLVKRMWKT